jgi:hypothetical protein
MSDFDPRGVFPYRWRPPVGRSVHPAHVEAAETDRRSATLRTGPQKPAGAAWRAGLAVALERVL